MEGRWRLVAVVSLVAVATVASVVAAHVLDPGPSERREDSAEEVPVEERVLGRWARQGGTASDVVCFGADGTCSGWSGRGEDAARWRLARSYGNTLVVEVTEVDSGLSYSHQLTVVVRGDELHEDATLFRRVQDRVESCIAQ